MIYKKDDLCTCRNGVWIVDLLADRRRHDGQPYITPYRGSYVRPKTVIRIVTFRRDNWRYKIIVINEDIPNEDLEHFVRRLHFDRIRIRLVDLGD